MATFVKRLGEQRLKLQIASYGVMQTGDTVAIAGKHAEGAVITAQKDYDAANNPRAKRFLETHQKKYGAKTPNYSSGLTYDATYIWKEAVEWTLKQGGPTTV